MPLWKPSFYLPFLSARRGMLLLPVVGKAARDEATLLNSYEYRGDIMVVYRD